MKKVILLLVSILLISSGFAFAEVPCKINYQGRLIKDGVPVHSPTGVPMVFNVDGKQVYSGNVPVYNGLFRVVLDLEDKGIDWTAGETKYLEVTVDGEQLTPREPLYAYPYAINSHLLEGKTTDYFLDVSGSTQTKQGGLNIMGNVGIGTTSLGAKLHIGGIAGTDGIMFPDGSIQTTAPAIYSAAKTVVCSVSTAWSDYPLSITETFSDSTLFITFTYEYSSTTGGWYNPDATFTINVDGTDVCTYNQKDANYESTNGYSHGTTTITAVTSVLAGSHTIRPRWRAAVPNAYSRNGRLTVMVF